MFELCSHKWKWNLLFSQSMFKIINMGYMIAIYPILFIFFHSLTKVTDDMWQWINGIISTAVSFCTNWDRIKFTIKLQWDEISRFFFCNNFICKFHYFFHVRINWARAIFEEDLLYLFFSFYWRFAWIWMEQVHVIKIK